MNEDETKMRELLVKYEALCKTIASDSIEYTAYSHICQRLTDNLKFSPQKIRIDPDVWMHGMGAWDENDIEGSAKASERYQKDLQAYNRIMGTFYEELRLSNIQKFMYHTGNEA